MPKPTDPGASMTARELTSTLSLGSIFALRMLGLFLILPVFSLWAMDLPDKPPAHLVGLAFGIYGLTQGILQIPFGAASDKWGRKPVIVAGLVVFVAGSVLAALSDDITSVIIARALQGAGAVSAAVTAMISDSVRERVLTRAMAVVGASIGSTFALSLVLSPVLSRWIGVEGLFWLTAALATAGIAVMIWVVPPVDPKIRQPADTGAGPAPGAWSVVLDRQLMLLNAGIFFLHLAQMALFVVVPLRLADLGLAQGSHWMVYLPSVLISFAFMMPAIKAAERRGAFKTLFTASIALVGASFLGFELLDGNLFSIGLLLLVFFCGFNILEATLPSLVSVNAPATSKGLALGVYNTTQSIGLFAGGAVGGWLLGHYGSDGVYVFCAALMAVWFAAAACLMDVRRRRDPGRQVELQ